MADTPSAISSALNQRVKTQQQSVPKTPGSARQSAIFERDDGAMKLLGIIFALALITIVGETYSDVVLTGGEPAAADGDAVAGMIARGAAKVPLLPFTPG